MADRRESSTAAAMTFFGIALLAALLAMALFGCEAERMVTVAAAEPPELAITARFPAIATVPAVRLPHRVVELPEFVPPVTAPEPMDAESALIAVGATPSEVQFALPICQRESHCTLEAHNYNPSTRDDSLGPWQINFWGAQASRLAALGIYRETVNASWRQAAGSFLILLRAVGRCPWQAPDYCS